MALFTASNLLKSVVFIILTIHVFQFVCWVVLSPPAQHYPLYGYEHLPYNTNFHQSHPVQAYQVSI